mgnify:CR=1 FL=1
MQRPVRPDGLPMVMAVMYPEELYNCTKLRYHIQTRPLLSNRQLLPDQVNAFNHAREEMDKDGNDLTITLSRAAHVASNTS